MKIALIVNKSVNLTRRLDESEYKSDASTEPNMKVRKSKQTMPKEKYKFTMKLLSKMDTLDIKKQSFSKVKPRRSEKLDLVDEKYLKTFVKASREENSKKVIFIGLEMRDLTNLN